MMNMTVLKNKWRFFIVCIVLFTGYIAEAQNVLQVQGAAPNYYFTYKVQPRETLSGIGKIFGVSVGDIMRVNKMNTNSKLIVGQNIKIPLNAKNVSKENGAGSVELVHKIQKGESLYRISQNYNKVSVDLLKQWNNLKGNNLEVGKTLVIGYLQPKGNVDLGKSVAATTAAVTTPAAKKEDIAVTKNEPVDTTSSQDISFEPKKEQPETTKVTTAPSVVPPPATTTSTKQPDTAPTTKLDLSDSGEGYFAPGFGYDVDGREMKVASGPAMTFKTASGWTDKKFYILMNDIPPGSIVKVSFNNKVIYAKVLWNMGTMKENEGLKYRISNAAASALGITDPKFELNVLYYE